MNKKLSIHEKEELLLAHIDKFVKESLRGRYREHVGDAFLTYLLLLGSRGIFNQDVMGCVKTPENLAYEAACSIFESNLEHHCRAGGNGHHVAQDFAKHIKGFILP